MFPSCLVHPVAELQNKLPVVYVLDQHLLSKSIFYVWRREHKTSSDDYSICYTCAIHPPNKVQSSQPQELDTDVYSNIIIVHS